MSVSGSLRTLAPKCYEYSTKVDLVKLYRLRASTHARSAAATANRASTAPLDLADLHVLSCWPSAARFSAAASRAAAAAASPGRAMRSRFLGVTSTGIASQLTQYPAASSRYLKRDSLKDQRQDLLQEFIAGILMYVRSMSQARPLQNIRQHKQQEHQQKKHQ